jgi:hypothetical protein
MQTIKPNYYSKHLNFEPYPNSREWKLDRCNKVLEMISRLKDRNFDIADTCERFYGRRDGNIVCPDNMSIKYHRNLATIERLKKYFNFCLERVNKF